MADSGKRAARARNIRTGSGDVLVMALDTAAPADGLIARYESRGHGIVGRADCRTRLKPLERSNGLGDLRVGLGYFERAAAVG